MCDLISPANLPLLSSDIPGHVFIFLVPWGLNVGRASAEGGVGLAWECSLSEIKGPFRMHPIAWICTIEPNSAHSQQRVPCLLGPFDHSYTNVVPGLGQWDFSHIL